VSELVAVITALNALQCDCLAVQCTLHLEWFVTCKVCWFVTLTEQLAEIRKVTLAKVICLNSDNISTIQPSVMLLPFRQVYHSSQ